MKNNDKCFIPLVGFNFMSTRIEEGIIASQIKLISKSLYGALYEKLKSRQQKLPLFLSSS